MGGARNNKQPSTVLVLEYNKGALFRHCLMVRNVLSTLIISVLCPFQDEYEDQELSSYKLEMFFEYEVELTVEKADDDAQLRDRDV